MAMTTGGLLILGVADDRTITGCPLTQKTRDRIKQAASVCQVAVQVREIQVGETPLTLVGVPEVRGRIVTTPDGRLLRRVGSECQPLVGDAMARFVRERGEHAAEDELVDAWALGDIDLHLVNEALSRDSRPPVDESEVLRALVDLQVAKPQVPPLDTALMRAGAVLFMKRPSRHVSGARVQLVRRLGIGPGPGPTEDRLEAEGPVPRLVQQCLDFVQRHSRRFEVVIGSRRETWPEYPEPVLREAILNALAHRDYGLTGSTVDITVWDDRIEVTSPGPLPGHITTENMRMEHYSRNPRIMRVLKMLSLVEEDGEGVDRMYDEMEARMMEPPVFVANSGSVTVTLYNRFLADIDEQAWLSLLGHYQLSQHERRMLLLARRQGALTPRALRQELAIDNVDHLLQAGVAKGLLTRQGDKGGSHYRLSPEVVLRAGGQGLEAQSRKRQTLLEEMRRLGSISTAEGAALLNEQTSVVRHLLNDLVNAGLARAEGRTRARRYLSL